MASATTSPCCELLCKAVLPVLKDDGFSISLEPAWRVHFMAETYLKRYMRGENWVVLTRTCERFRGMLFVAAVCLRRNNENICGRATVSSVHLFCLPTTGLIICHQPVAQEIPVLFFYQFVTDVIFEGLMKRHVPVLTIECECHDSMDKYTNLPWHCVISVPWGTTTPTVCACSEHLPLRSVRTRQPYVVRHYNWAIPVQRTLWNP